ncbi:MAG TPA: dockerin [Polyangia bacterium]|nr:dockerin [Polyangia bacterium]
MGVIGTGQSLAVGNLGVPVNTVDSVFHNLKISLGQSNGSPPFDPNDASLSLVPLTEPIRALVPLAAYPSAYPANIFGETPHSFMANQISTLYAPWNQGEYVTVHSVVGESGQGIAVISKGAPDTGRTGRAYAATLFEVKAIARLAKAAGKTYGVGAIIFTHGEEDATNKNYGAAVHQLWSDYNADLRVITGQTTSIPMLLTQQHSAPFTAGSAADSTQAAWRLGVMYPGDIVCAGPKYQYQYQSEGRHLTTPGYDRLGAKYAEIYYQTIALGRQWQPLQPKSAVKNGKTITIDFNVPVGPLNWDENIPPPHQTTMTEWAKGRGFEVRNASGRATIDSVAIVGSTVVLTLAADSQASGWVVGYATVQDDAGQMAGPTRGRRGQLRDSDPFVAVDAQTIRCTVTSGSAQVQARTPGSFRTREGRDLATGAGLKPETIVVTKTSDSAMTLSQPWTGSSGTADLAFRNDQRNYCVSFEMPLP